MTGTGFYEQQKFRPQGFALVIALHAAALGALILIKSPIYEPERDPPMVGTFIPIPPDPEVEPPPPTEVVNPPPQSTVFTAPRDDTVITTKGPETTQEPREQLALATGTGTIGIDIPDLPPVRVDAIFDPRFAANQQPPYPTSEERAQREGRVRLRVTIGADGRVKAVQRLDATSDAFWRSTERHARSRWRFRPATVDGRPIESTKVLTITFQIEV